MTNNLLFYDIAIIGEITEDNPTPAGEAPTYIDHDSPMTQYERSNMVQRLYDSIYELMCIAEEHTIHLIHNNHILRLCTNEFYFYTKEPLTIQEFETLQNLIAITAQDLNPKIVLMLGSFAVITEDNKVMNIIPFITCGPNTEFKFIIKNYTSDIDVRYKALDNTKDTLLPFDVETANESRCPSITVREMVISFTFYNILQCITQDETPYITVVDICLDHCKGVGEENYECLQETNEEISRQPVSHVVLSNRVELNKRKCLSKVIFHVDPYYTRITYGAPSKAESILPEMPFGNAQSLIYIILSNLQNILYSHAGIENSSFLNSFLDFIVAKSKERTEKLCTDEQENSYPPMQFENPLSKTFTDLHDNVEDDTINNKFSQWSIFFTESIPPNAIDSDRSYLPTRRCSI